MLKREKHPHHQQTKLKRSTPCCQKGRMKKRLRFMKKYRDTYSTRPSTFKQQRSFNHDKGINKRQNRDQPRHEFRRTTLQKRTFTPRYLNFFYGHCFICTKFGHKVVYCKAYGINVQARNAMWLHITLNVTNVTIMVTWLVIVELLWILYEREH
jgi:hypothetical protein